MRYFYMCKQLFNFEDGSLWVQVLRTATVSWPALVWFRCPLHPLTKAICQKIQKCTGVVTIMKNSGTVLTTPWAQRKWSLTPAAADLQTRHHDLQKEHARAHAVYVWYSALAVLNNTLAADGSLVRAWVSPTPRRTVKRVTLSVALSINQS